MGPRYCDELDGEKRDAAVQTRPCRRGLRICNMLVDADLYAMPLSRSVSEYPIRATGVSLPPLAVLCFSP